MRKLTTIDLWCTYRQWFQELLREKQHHLERLMRERELERTEVAKASLQADRAESALAQLKKEASQVWSSYY